MRLRWICLILVAMPTLPVWAQDPADRDTRRRSQPGLLIEPGGRFAPADVLQFSADGKKLYAAGDDKVLRRWEFDATAEKPLSQQELLRWAVYRQKRGSIYAMAELPGDRVAIAGFGVVAGTIVVLDSQGKVVHSVPDQSDWATWALAASADGRYIASGQEDGEVRLWTLPQGRNPGAVTKLGKHDPIGKDKQPGRVLALAFEGVRSLLSVGEDGVVRRWNLTRPGQPGTEVLRFQKVRYPSKVSISGDGKWIAAGGSYLPRESDDTTVEVRSLQNPKASPQIKQMPDHQHVQCLALNAEGSRLAVGAFEVTMVRNGPTDVPLQQFQNFASGPVHLYDLSKIGGPTAKLETTLFADMLAFHPTKPYLVVTGGANHEMTLWRLGAPPTRKQTLTSQGRCLWGIAFDPRNPTRFGVQTQRQNSPRHPNDQGDGPWYSFDLRTRDWKTNLAITKPEFENSINGWQVRFGRPKPGDPTSILLDYRKWYVVSPAGEYFLLPMNSEDGLPRCYSFLPDRKDGKVRLALGHYYGYTLYEIDPRAKPKPTVRRIRAGQGHDGEVMALAPSADGKLLLTAGSDQTVCCWDLTSTFPHQPELGASFSVRDGKVVAAQVAPGSPVADAGMQPGDEILEFELGNGLFYYNAEDATVRATPTQCVEQLKKIAPNTEHYFRVRRGPGTVLEMKTGVRRFPIWRLLPLFSDKDEPTDWVIYRFRDYYYDASTHGARYLGWQVNGPESGDGIGDENRTPTFYTAELWNRRFHRPEKIQEVVAKPDILQDLIGITRIEPPRIEFTATRIDPRAGTTVQLKVSPRNPKDPVGKVSLWVNGALFRSWPTGGALPKTVTVPIDWLRRTGTNHLDLIADNSDGSTRATARTELGPVPGGAGKRRLFAVLVGIGDYGKARFLAGGQQPSDLRFTFFDARRMEKLAGDMGRHFDDAEIVLLGDAEATTQAIRQALLKVGQTSGPDDHVLFFFSGHGMQDFQAQTVHLPQRLTLITYDTNLKKPQTGLNNVELARLLGDIRGHKLVLLDACHSGGAAPAGIRRDETVHQIRALMPDDVGPVIITASDFRHESLEDPQLGQGVFTASLLQTLRQFPGQRSIEEIAPVLTTRVRNLSRQVGQKLKMPNFEQVPTFRIPRNEANVVWFRLSDDRKE